jgi:hypothetical protein
VSRRATIGRYSGEYGRLEDLLRFDEARSPMPIQRRPPWRLRTVMITLALALVAETAARLAGFDPPGALILALSAAVVGLHRLLGLIAEPSWRSAADFVRPVLAGAGSTSVGWFGGGDGMLEAIRRWSRRLEWGATSPERYALTVAGRLGELADYQLRQLYGGTRASDPGRARAVLGEQVWRALHPPAGWMPSESELARVVNRLVDIRDGATAAGGQR